MILRALAMSPSASQNASSRLMFVLRPSIETVRLTTVDFGTIAQPYPGLLAGLNHLCETHGSGEVRRSPGHGPMTATMRLTGLGSGIDKDRPELGVYCGEWGFGRIYETRGGPDNSAPVLVNDRQRPDDALRPGGDPGGGKRNPFRPNRDFLQEFVRPHDLVRKVCNFSGSCSGAVSEELGMHGRRGGDRKEADDLHNPRNRRLFACLSMCAPRVLPPLWRGPRRPWMPKRQGLSAGTFVTIRL